MKIRYVGSAGVRIIGSYTWNAENGYVQDVAEPEIVENLLTYPRPDFEPVEGAEAEQIASDLEPKRKKQPAKE